MIDVEQLRAWLTSDNDHASDPAVLRGVISACLIEIDERRADLTDALNGWESAEADVDPASRPCGHNADDDNARIAELRTRAGIMP